MLSRIVMLQRPSSIVQMRLSLSGAAAAAGATQLTGERFSAGAKAFDESVRGHKGVLVFSKTTCPYCDRVKKAFDSKSIPYSVVELDRVDKSPEIRTELTRLSGIVRQTPPIRTQPLPT